MGNTKSKLTPEKLKDLQRKTRFTEKEINQWHKGFLKDCPAGSLTKKDFEKIYKDYFPFGDSVKYSSYVFKHLDLDNNGIVDFDEFLFALDISAKGDVEEKLNCT